MRPTPPTRDEHKIHFQGIVKALHYVVEHYSGQPSTSRMAQIAGMDEDQFHALFLNWVGISPKRFVQSISRNHALKLLKSGESSLSATLAIGLSSPSRLHDLMVNTDGMTPAQVRALGANIQILWGVTETKLGNTFIACVRRDAEPLTVCKLLFGNEHIAQQGLNQIQRDWPAAHFIHAQDELASITQAAISRDETVRLHIRGTGFQIHVWQALLRIPQGQLVSYGSIAQALGRPKAHRAVGTAVGSNPISVLIPCHRVIQRSGALGGYAWGLERKLILLGQELAEPDIGYIRG